LTIITACIVVDCPYVSGENIPEKQQVTLEASVGIFNKYIFRGYELSKNSMVIQPFFSASFKGFEASVWGNMDTNQHKTQSFDPGNSEGRAGFNEMNATPSYTYRIDKLNLTGGYTYYSFKYWDNTDEFFISATYNILTKPTFAIYRDVNAYSGTYINLSFAHSLDVGKSTTLDLGASAGYYAGNGSCWNTYEYASGGYTGPKYNALHDGYGQGKKDNGI